MDVTIRQNPAFAVARCQLAPGEAMKAGAVVACYGAIETIELADGEGVVLDSGHLVAFDPTVQYKTRKVTKGIMQTLKSGEGFVMEFTGPGKILSQTRNPGELIDWLTVELPFTRES